MSDRLLSRFAILLAATLAPAISATAQETEAVEEPESRFSGIIQADFSNAYFFRGILQERDSLIAQPWGELYYFYTSPNDAFEHVQELNLKLAWDDSELLGRFAMQPWINLSLETHKTSFGPNKGEGFQLGIEPTLCEIPIENYPVTLTAPIELGLALDDYYEKENGNEGTFGYVSYGITASVPLTFMPEAAEPGPSS